MNPAINRRKLFSARGFFAATSATVVYGGWVENSFLNASVVFDGMRVITNSSGTFSSFRYSVFGYNKQ